MASTRKPPPGAMMTAVLVRFADFAGNTVRVGTVTFRTMCIPRRDAYGIAGVGGCCAPAVAAASKPRDAKPNEIVFLMFFVFPARSIVLILSRLRLG